MKPKKEHDSVRKYLTTKELAQRWQLHPGTLRNWRCEGLGPDFVRIGAKGTEELPKSRKARARVLYSLDSIRQFEYESGLVEDDFYIKIELD